MAKKAETVEEKLRALYDLQLIDSRIDEIRNMRRRGYKVKDIANKFNVSKPTIDSIIYNRSYI